jgi:small subunit ribosomal protein S8
MTDPVADYLTRLRNAIRARHKRVDVPASTLKRELTKLLVAQKFIASFSEVKESAQGVLRIQLKYNDGQPVIAGLRRVSRPGLRHYVDADGIPRVLGGLGVDGWGSALRSLVTKEIRTCHELAENRFPSPRE